MSREDVFGLYPETLAVGAGVTCAISTMPGQNACILKWVSGGTLVVIGASLSTGSTFAINNQYIVGTSEILNLAALSGKIFITAVGSTMVCSLIRGRSEGFAATDS